jgi:hypothetical protein
MRSILGEPGIEFYGDDTSFCRTKASALSLWALQPTNCNETKVGQALSRVQMWGRRSRLPIPVSTVPSGLESPLRGESILPGVRMVQDF